MKSKHPLSWLFILISVCWLLIYHQSAQAAPGLTIGNYQLVSSKRITRTVFEYTYKASVTNTGNDAVGVSAQLSINAPGVTALDDKLEFSDVSTGKTIASKDTFVLRHDRNYSFKVGVLQWLIDASPAALLINNVMPSSGLPGTKVAITLQGIINDGADLTLSLGGQSLPYSFRDDSESVIEFTVPSNIPSASLFVSQQEQQSNGVWFDVTSNAVRIPAANEIALDELGNKVAINLVLVSFHENDYTLSEAQRVANIGGAEITAALPLVDGYQFKLQTTNLEELQQAISILESDPAVDFVVRETHIPSNEVPTLWNIGYIDDPRPLQRYLNRVVQGATRYRANVDPSEAGKHRPTPIKIGVTELGVDFDDNDFKKYADNGAGYNNITIDSFDLPSLDNELNHGTVVAGMIAAGLYDDVIQPNIDFTKCIGGCNAGFLQGLGLSHAGFEIRVHQVGLRDAVIDSLQQVFWSSSMYSEATENLLKWGANVINWSFGVQEESQATCFGGTVSSNPVSNRVFNNNKKLFAKLLTTIKTKYPKVIIVSAAGNGFTLTNENTVIPSGIQSDAMIVVGAHLSVEGISSKRPICTSLNLENADGLKEEQTQQMPLRSGYSNYGSQVHISAVGEVIDSYGTLKGGTSFAAPLATATVAAMKSIKPDLTAVEARHLLRKYALPMYPKVNISPGNTLEDTTALLTVSNGEVRPDGGCFSDPTLWCEGMGARLNVEGAIQGVLNSLTTDTPLSSLPFPDAKLLACVFEDAKRQYVEQVTSLSCAGKEITNLSGLENLKQLTSLDLSGNTITDLSPLIGLTQLQQLNLSGDTGLRCVELDELAVALSSTTITRPASCIQANTPDINYGLVAHYSLDGNASDLSGNGRDGTAYGGTSYVDGVTGQAASFDGVDDYIDLPDKLLTSETYTISLFVKVGEGNLRTDKPYMIFDGWTDSEIVGLQYGENLYYAASEATVGNSGLGNYLIGNFHPTYSETILYGERHLFHKVDSTFKEAWHHVVLSYDGKIARYYLDGTLLYAYTFDSSVQTYSGGISRTDSLSVLNYSLGASMRHMTFFSGAIDEVRIYNRAISEEEIFGLGFDLNPPVPN